MKRKQLLLPEDLEKRIQLRAKMTKTSEAQTIRQLLEVGLTHTTSRATVGKALLNLAKLGEKHGVVAPPDLSSKIDDYLYGDKK